MEEIAIGRQSEVMTEAACAKRFLRMRTRSPRARALGSVGSELRS